MRTSALFGTKNSDFSKLTVCPHGQEGVEPVRMFFLKRGGGSIFLRFCSNVFIDGLLWEVAEHGKTKIYK